MEIVYILKNLTCRGVFEVHRSGKVPDLCGGVQAHLSTCASPKVLEVANKFPHKVLLNEVPRSSMWPAQFQDCSVKEDNVGLYFFAKDLERLMITDNFLLNGLFNVYNFTCSLKFFSVVQLREKLQEFVGEHDEE